MNAVCSECGAILEDGAACREYLNEMITWDFEDFAGAGQVHHLTVLSYNLQHPSGYSAKGLANAKEALIDFLENPESFKEHDARNRQQLASDVRDWNITGTDEDRGTYEHQPVWKIRASDVVHGGLQNYVENVKKWAISLRESLQESGNLN